MTTHNKGRRTTGMLDNVSVIVLCCNRQDEVALNIPPRLRDVQERGLELIVVDNFSTDGSREFLEKLYYDYPKFDLVLNPSNLGVGGGRNSGWDRATRKYVVTLDEDTRITSEQLCQLVDALRNTPKAGIVTPIMYHTVTERLLVKVLQPPYRATNFLGACYAIRREVIETVGNHDPGCNFGGEELDLSIRARNAGWDVFQVPDIWVGHNGRPRPGGIIPLMRRAPWTQNHARVVWRWFPYHRALPWSILMLGEQLRAAWRQKTFSEWPILMRSWLAGVTEGIKMHEPVHPSVTQFYARRLGLIREKH
jgi:GT2 family glycosyltransferase